MSWVSEDSGSLAVTKSGGTPGRRTLLSVLPLTTAWVGAAAVVAVPIAGVVVGSVVERSPSGLSFILIMVPVLVGAAAATFVCGLAAGALAGLPDWFLRRRPLGTVGVVAAVVILTVLVAGASGAAFLVAPYLVPWPVLTQVCVVAAATAIATLVVVALHRRRERRRHQ
ncbi:hypothetical protein [Curtobacterium sp. PhB172]|uniref:hypothetical protein n=1 Tax=Curtobacterium sp. PhB172 TaxID=2485196 RepID=UPI0011CE7564|nr:hypothetical protein [Curtobacterium sp. PhB172]